METDKDYIEMFDICSIRYYANVNETFRAGCVCDSSTLAIACETPYRSSRRDCGFGGWYAWSFTYPHR
jgi:hypothetical protein